MSVTELFRPDTHAGQIDGSKEAVTRIFRVDGPPYSALVAPDLPQLHSIYPYGNQNTPFPMILDRFSTMPTEDAIATYVICHYSNDRSGRLSPHADTTKPGFQSWSVSYQDTTSDFPTLLVFPLRVSGVGSDVPGVSTQIYKVTETVQIYQISVVLQGFNSETAYSIAAQNNRLHKIGGVYYRFKAGDIKQTEKAAWETVYTWIYDGGTPVPVGQIADTRYAAIYGGGNIPVPYPSITIGPAVDERVLYLPSADVNKLKLEDSTLNDTGIYVRSPYHTISFYLQRNMVPIWTQICAYKLNPLGWKSLPGNLRL